MNNQETEAHPQEWSEAMRRSLEKEMQSFRGMLPGLLSTHRGLFVAVADGRIVDQDENEITLAQRVSQRFVDKFVLIQEVKAEAPPESLVRVAETVR